VNALLALHESTEDKHWLQLALKLTDKQLELYHDKINGGFFESASDQHVLFRSRSAYDGALPSANAIAIENLDKLARITQDKKWQQLADHSLSAFSAAINVSPASAGWMVSVIP
jgi:uncharacterized protein YyaL (SSP411 family)